MPAKDKFHQAVRVGLEHDAWVITDDPLYLEYGGVNMYVDLAADKIVAAEKGKRKIAVEIKSFSTPSLIAEFHKALGQFINYRTALQIKEPERQLYLAVPEDTYKEFFVLPFVQLIKQQQQLKLLVYDIEQEVIVEWHE